MMLLSACGLAGCLDFGGCTVEGTSLHWTEDGLWPRLPPDGVYGDWTMHSSRDGYVLLAVNHSRTPGWAGSDGLPLTQVWWRSPLADGAPLPEVFPDTKAPPGWIVLKADHETLPGGRSVAEVQAAMIAPAGVSANDSLPGFRAFLDRVLAPGAPRPADVQTWHVSASTWYVMMLPGPFALERLYTDVLYPSLAMGSLRQSIGPIHSDRPDPPVFLPLQDWGFGFAEQQVTATRADGVALTWSSQGGAESSVESARASEGTMRKEATAAYAALGLGRPSFDDTRRAVSERCPDP
jgi:hypothetical protein